MNEFQLLEEFTEKFSPAFIYDGAYGVAVAYMSAISGVLLIIAIFIRSMTTSVDSLDGNGRWAGVVKSTLIWGVVLATYFGLAGLVTDLFNALYAWSRTNGSIGLAFEQLGAALETVDKAAEPKDAVEAATQVLMKVVPGLSTLSALGSITRFVSYVMFFLSAVLVVFVQIFFQIAQAFGYAMALIVGTVAIPLAVSQKLSILKGWGKFTAIILTWPIIEALAMYFIVGMTSGLTTEYLVDLSGDGAAAGIYLLFTIMNLIMVAILIAAPFVTQAIISNSGNIAGLVTPFIGGAMAAAGAFTRTFVKSPASAALSQAGQAGASAAGGAASSIASKLIGGGTPAASVTNTQPAATGPQAAKKVDVTQGATTKTPSPAMAQAVSETVNTASVAGEAVVENGAEPAPPSADPAKQAKRGAIINNLKKASK